MCSHSIKVKSKTENAVKPVYLQTTTSESHKIKDETGKKYGRLKVKSFAYTENSKAYWNCICDCGTEKIVCGNHLRTGKISSCGCLVSRKEEEVVAILKQYGIIYKREVTFPDLKDKRHLRFDFAIYNLAGGLIGLIEYQGSQHYEDNPAFTNNGRLQIHDQMKKEYCLLKNIPLLELNKQSNLEKDILQWYQDNN